MSTRLEDLQSDYIIDPELIERAIEDSGADKRIPKTGYVRQYGGLYPSECDSVAAHSQAVSLLAVKFAFEVRDALKNLFGTELDMEEIALMAIFHDHGEGRSQDPGAISSAIGSCDAKQLERLGLEASVRGMRVEQRAMALYDDYRDYRTLASIIVHMADTLEGVEKALHAGAGRSPGIVKRATEAAQGAVASYRHRKAQRDETKFLVDQLFVPGLSIIGAKYGIELGIS